MPNPLALLLMIASGFVLVAEDMPQAVSETIDQHIQSTLVGPGKPGLSAFAALDTSSPPFTLGWPIAGFAAAGDVIWEAALMEAGATVTVVVWHNPSTGKTRIVARDTLSPNSVQTPQPESLPDIDLSTLALSTPKRVEDQLSKTLQAEGRLAPDEHIVVQGAMRPSFAIDGFCEYAAWIWPCRVVSETNHVRGLIWVNAATAAHHILLMHP